MHRSRLRKGRRPYRTRNQRQVGSYVRASRARTGVEWSACSSSTRPAARNRRLESGYGRRQLISLGPPVHALAAITEVVSNTAVGAPVSRIPLVWMMPTGTDPAVSALLPPLPARASDVTRAAGRQAGHGGQKISCAPEWAVTLVIATPPPMIAPL